MAVRRFVFVPLFLIITLFPVPATPLISQFTCFPGPVPLTEDVIIRNKDRKIVRFDIFGADQENRHIIRSIVDLKAGDYLASLDLKRMYRQLNNTGLFAQVGLFFRPGREGYVITLRLKQKQDLIVLPFVKLSGSDVHTGGAFFTETLLEPEAQNGEATVWQPGGINGVIKYINPHFQGQKQNLAMIFSGSRETKYQTDTEARVIRQFRGYFANLDMDWKFRTGSKFRPALYLYLDQFDVESQWKETINPPESSEALSTGIELIYEDYYLLHFFDEGFQAAVRMSQKYIMEKNEPLFAFHATSDWNLNPIHQHRLHAGLRGGYNPVTPAILENLRGPGHLLLPVGRAVDRMYVSGITEYEVPVHINPWGTLTAFSFAEIGMYSPEEKEYQLYYGPGFGFRLYANGLSAPIIGASLGLNLDNSYIASSFFAGIQL